MRLLLAENWWSLVLRGTIGVLIGLMAIVWPGITFAALVLLFGAYALLDGVISLTGAWRASQAHDRWGSLVFEGIAGILAAALVLFLPAITALALVYVIAAWACVTGIFEIVTAVRLRKHIAGEWLLALGGIASVIFGILLFAAPIAGALVLALWVGFYCLFFGALLLALGLRLRHWWKELHPPDHHAPQPAH